MNILHIQHSVPDFHRWKEAFDGDPMDRRGSGVRGYRVYRSVTDRGLVMIDLEFDTAPEAERMLGRLRQLWSGPGGAFMRDPEGWILETVASESL